MAEVLTVLLEKVLPPVLSGAGGVLLSAWRLTKALSDRVKALEDTARQVAIDYNRDHADLKEADAELEQAVATRASELKTQIQSRSRELSDLRKVQDRLLVRTSNAEQRLDAFDHVIADLQDQVRRHIKEQADQWQSMSRTLGQLEGYVRGMTRKSPSGSGEYPGTKG